MSYNNIFQILLIPLPNSQFESMSLLLSKILPLEHGGFFRQIKAIIYITMVIRSTTVNSLLIELGYNEMTAVILK